MRLFANFIGLLIFAAAVWGCQGNSSTVTVTEPPGMTREKPAPATTVSEAIHASGTAGNFDGLVADYESKNRAIWQKPDLVISMFGDLSDKVVADIGAGTGYFTFRLVPKAKKVIGIDIDQRFIAFMDSVKVRLPEAYRHRFEPRLAKFDDPGLQPNEADAVIIVNTYGYLEHRVQYLKTLAKGMNPKQGELLIIDFKKNNLPVGPSMEFKVSSKQVEQELISAGFKIVKTDLETLDYQYIVLASLQ